MMYSILKFPAMCEQYQKALKRKLTTKKFKQLEQDSIQLLRQHINEENQEEFFDEFSSRLASDPFSKNFVREALDDASSKEQITPVSKQSRKRDIDQSRLVNIELRTESSESPTRPKGPAGLIKLAQSLQNSPESRNAIESDMNQMQPKMSLSLQRDIGYSLNFLKTHKGRTEQISPVKQDEAMYEESSTQNL